MKSFDVVVIGGGIVGAACALELSRRGLQTVVIEAGPLGGGATAAGMGHVVVMDDSEAEFELTRRSRELWLEVADELSETCEFRRCGTIWVAADEEEFAAVHSKHEWYGTRGVKTEILDGRSVRQAEPNLRDGLAGGLLVPDDVVLYAPAAAAWLLSRAAQVGCRVVTGRVSAVEQDAVRLMNGERIGFGTAVCANGCGAPNLFPEIPVRPKKGHLVITDRYPGFVNHQLVELGYLKSAHGSARESVAFNAQPRATGQVLLGSSRQFGVESGELDWPLLRRMLQRGFEYMPGLQRLSVVRAWTGFRAATPDGLPLIGPLETRPNVLLATGHEGLGITTSLATGELIASMVAGTRASIADEPFRPSRCRPEQMHV